MGAVKNNSGFVKYTAWLEKVKIYVIAFWVIAFCSCIYWAPSLIDKTTYTFNPPPNSLAGKGNTAMKKDFPSSFGDGATDLALFIFSKDGSSILRDDVQNFSLSLYTQLYNYRPSDPTFIQQCMGYYIAIAQDMPLLAPKFVSPNYTSTLISITASTPYSSNLALDFSSYISKSAADSWHPVNDTIDYELLGTAAFLPMLKANAERDFLVVDGISLPLALLVLACILRSLRLMIIPVVCIGTSIVVTFGLTYIAACYLNVVAFTPSLMMSILVAMSFDYSLFLLSRYREVLGTGYGHRHAVETMLVSAGHTITVSGVTLAGTFMGLVILPLEMLRTLGMGSAISITVTLLVNITLTPAMLLTFSDFFPKCAAPTVICGKVIGGDRTSRSEKAALLNYRKPKSGFWYKLGRITTTFPWNILLVLAIIGAIVPCALHSISYKKSDSFSVALPRHQPITNAYNLMCEQFGYGTVFPYVLLMQAPEGQTVMNDAFFTDSQTTISELVRRVPNTYSSNFNTVSYGGGFEVSYDEYAECANTTSPVYNDTICLSLRYAALTMVNQNQTSMLIYVTLSWDPLSQDGFAWLDSARSVLADMSNTTNCTFYLTGIVADSLDSILFVYSAFPIMAATTVAVVLLFVGISFRSILVPLRSVLTITITLAFVYGFAALTYQYGIFKWTGFEGLITSGSLYWIPPLVSFSIIVGIGLDYDIFLITRIQEFRQEGGYSTKDAILKGLHKTGGIITAAGVIMSIAFSGLLFSDISAMNQLSFFLLFSVLFDTFIVRSLMVPSLMGLLGEANWFPRRMPEPSKEPLNFM